LVFFTQGVGMFFGYMIAGELFKRVESYEALSENIAANKPEQTLSFAESFARMFSMNLPSGVDQQLLATTMDQWKEFWLVPAGMAAVILVIFAAAFWDRSADDLDPEPTAETSELVK